MFNKIDPVAPLLFTNSDNQKSNDFESKEYWQSFFLRFSIERLPSYYNQNEVAKVSLLFEDNLNQIIQRFCNQNSINPLSLLLSVVGLYFSRLSETGDNTNNLVTGIALPATLEQASQNDNYKNILPVNVKLLFGQSFIDLVKDSQANIEGAVEQYPCRIDSSNYTERLPDILVSSREDGEILSLNELSDLIGLDKPSIPLKVQLERCQDTKQLMLSLEYNRRYLSGTEAQLLAERLKNITLAGINAKESPVEELAIVSSQECDKLLNLWNQTNQPYPDNTTLHQLFEAQVESVPDNIALEYDDQKISYAELNKRANQIAHVLVKEYQMENGEAIKPDTLIAIYMDKSPSMIAAILAILKTGAAYVPIAPDYPKLRTSYILEDTEVSFVITEKCYQNKLLKWFLDDDINARLLAVDNSKKYINVRTDNLQNISKISNLVNVIYTSGTTGKPKGVMVEHRGVVSLVMNCGYVELSSADVFIYLSNPSFDAANFEIWGALTQGARLLIPAGKSSIEPEQMKEFLDISKISVLFVTKTLFDNLFYFDPTMFKQLRYILVGGEVLNAKIMADFIAQSERPEVVYNVYGPTESTTFATIFRCGSFEGAVPIGKPINTRKLYVLDDEHNLLPTGVAGELYIGGAGIARGYLNRPTLTLEKFIDNPFLSSSDEAKTLNKLYQTGDIVRWLPDGNIEYLDRKDSQVKIRGFRIELSEIESVVVENISVERTVVISKEHQGNKYLACYVVVSVDASFELSTLREELSNKLPDYMVPNTYTEIDAIPLTLNGKVDKQALPEPKFESNNEYTAPRNELEFQLADLWQTILGVEKVGINDNFFRLGGNSIIATRLTAVIRRKLEVDVSLASLMEHQSIAAICEQMTDQELVTIPRSAIEHAPLSFAQERLYFVEQFRTGNSAYHIPLLVKLKDKTCIRTLEVGLNYLFDRHSVLKTIYLTDEYDLVYQQTTQADVVMLSQKFDSFSEFQSELKIETVRAFDLSTEPSVRLRYYQVNGEQYLLILWNHIAFDGWSTNIFLQELAEGYDAFNSGSELSLPALDISYADYAVWQRNWLQGPVLENQLNYWKQQLSGFELLRLPTDFSRPKKVDYQGSNFHFEFDSSLSNSLRELAKAQETTFFNVLLSGFYVSLSVLSGQQDIIVGTPSDNRHHAQTQSLVGFFVNSLVLRANINPEDSISTFISQVHQTTTQGKVHQDLPFEKLVDVLNIERDLSRHPIFQVMFVVQNFWQQTDFELPFEIISNAEEDNETSSSKFDITLFINDGKDQLSGVFNYASSLFEADSIERLQSIYQQVLESFIASPNQLIGKIDTLSLQEKLKLLRAWNQTTVEYPQKLRIHQMFEAQVNKTSEKVAIVDEQVQLTYQQLNDKANQLAHSIRENYGKTCGGQLDSDTLIGLYVDKSIDAVIGILGILKAGAAYVPFTPEQPDSRVKFMLSDAQIKLLVTPKRYLSSIEKNITNSKTNPSILILDSIGLNSHSIKNLNIHGVDTDLAYIIYTSGSTGKPKGVMVEHEGVVNVLQNQKEALAFSNNEVVIWLASHVFDASVEQLFLALCFGAKLVVPSNVREVEAVKQLIENENVTHIHATPTYLVALGRNDNWHSVKRVVSGGEPISNDLKLIWRDVLINEYGPTEATITAIQCTDYGNKQEVNCIGKPLNNTQIYVVVEGSGQLAPVGSAGELLIAGAGVARGYLNQPELTEQCFVDNVFASEADNGKGFNKLYKTGDLVRWNKNGELEFLGRKDRQLKIRGYRIELGEIESELMSIPGVVKAVVIDINNNNNRYLASYLILEEPINFDSESYRTLLSERLPEYMVPTTYNVIDEVPITVNGKLDRRLLPEPLFNTEESYVGPRNSEEYALCSLWQEVLGIEKVGVYDNFFWLGGNSILAVQLTAAIRRKLNLEVSLIQLFEYKTIAGLCSSQPNKSIIISRETQQKSVLSFAQERFLFIERLEQGTDAYHIPYFVQLESNANLTFLQQAINTVVSRHPVLNSVYLTDENDDNYQSILDIPVQLETEVLGQASELTAHLMSIMSEQFDLKSQASFRVKHYCVDDQQYVLFLWHHIAFDGWSLNIFLKELSLAYQSLLQGSEIILPVLDISYADYAYWQRHFLQGTEKERLINYWKKQLADYQPLMLPTDYDRPKVPDYSGANKNLFLGTQLSEQLRTLVKDSATTLYTLMLGAFSITLAKICNQEDIVIGTPSDNRNHEQVQSLIGCFINPIVLRIKINPSISVKEFIGSLHERVMQGKIHEELPFEQLVDEIESEYDSSRHLIYQVMFSVQNFRDDLDSQKKLPFKPTKNTYIQENYCPAKFDLSLFVDDGKEDIAGVLNYAVSLFKPETIDNIIIAYIETLNAFVNVPEQSLSALCKEGVC